MLRINLVLFISCCLLNGTAQHPPNYKFPWIFGSDPCDNQNLQGTQSVDQSWINHYRKTDQWELVFEDNFDGSELDQKVWQTHFPWGPYITENHSIYYTQDNVKVENGILNLTMDRNPGFYDLWRFENGGLVAEPKWYEYTSGMIYSKVPYQGGKFEIRCKLPSNLEDLNPAFWLHGGCMQEIDVFEFLREDKQEISLSYHGSNVAPRICEEENHCVNTFDVSLSEDFHENKWHTYSVEWTINSIIWRIDGKIKRQVGRVVAGNSEIYNITVPGNYTRIPSFPYMDTPMYVIVNFGEVLTDNVRNGSLFWQRHMEVDYINIYKEKQCHLNIFVCDSTDIPVFVNHDDYFLMDTVNISHQSHCNYNLRKDQRDYFYYTSYGFIDNNSTISKGSIFELNPMSCSTADFKKGKSDISIEQTPVLSNDVQVYPNPFKDIIHVSVEEGIITRISLYSSVGLIKSKEYSTDYISIDDFKKLGRGVYYVKIQLNDGRETFRKIIHY